MINRDMKQYKLQQKTESQNDFGEAVVKWNDVGFVEIAIYPVSTNLYTNNLRYAEGTHTALTSYKDIKEGKNRVIDGEVIYNIISSNNKGRLSTLLLKVVDADV